MEPTVALRLRLRAARFVMGYENAKAFAESFNIRYTSYIQREKGTRPISLKILYEYARWLKVNPNWLLTGQGHPCPDHLEAEEKQKQIYSILHHEAMERVHAVGYAELSPQTKDILIDFSLFYSLLLRFNPTMKSKINAAIHVYNQISIGTRKPEIIDILINLEQTTMKKSKSKI